MHKGDKKEGGHAGDALEMTRRMREPWLWTNFTVITLGFWLITSAVSFGYDQTALVWSDLASRALLIFFGSLSLFPRWDFIGRWGASFVGVWLSFAPLVFWVPSPAAFVVFRAGLNVTYDRS